MTAPWSCKVSGLGFLDTGRPDRAVWALKGNTGFLPLRPGEQRASEPPTHRYKRGGGHSPEGAPWRPAPRARPPSPPFRSDALTSREYGLPASSELSEDQPQDWELNTHLGHERFASANDTVKVTGLKRAAGAGVSSRAGASAQLQAVGPVASSRVRRRQPGSSASTPPEFLGPSKPRKLASGVQTLSSALDTPDACEECASRAPSPGNGGWRVGRSPGPRRARRIAGQRRLASRFSASLAGAGSEQLKLQGLTPQSRAGRGRDSPVPGGAPGLCPCTPSEQLRSPTGGGRTAPSSGGPSPAATGTGRGREGTRSRAPPTLLASRSLPRRQSRPSSRPWCAQPSGERPGDSGRGRGSPWGCGSQDRVPPSLRSGHAGSAERNELGGARRARCSLAIRKATLAAGCRDAGLTHARAASMRGFGAASEALMADAGGGGGQEEGQGLPRQQPLEAPHGGVQTLERSRWGFCPQSRTGPPWPRPSPVLGLLSSSFRPPSFVPCMNSAHQSGLSPCPSSLHLHVFVPSLLRTWNVFSAPTVLPSHLPGGPFPVQLSS